MVVVETEILYLLNWCLRVCCFNDEPHNGRSRDDNGVLDIVVGFVLCVFEYDCGVINCNESIFVESVLKLFLYFDIWWLVCNFPGNFL